MKFSSLNPKISGTDISFDCPKCPGQRVWISALYRQPPDPTGRWSWTAPDDGSGGYDAITITPSINNHHHGKIPCGWHGSIVNGDIVP